MCEVNQMNFYYLVNDNKKLILFLGSASEWKTIFSTENKKVPSDLRSLIKNVYGTPKLPRFKELVGENNDNVRLVCDSQDTYKELMRNYKPVHR